MIPEDGIETSGPDRPQLVPLTGHLAPVISAVFSPDGRLLATTAADGQVILWDAVSGSIQKLWQDNGDLYCGARWAAFSPDGQTLAVGGPEITLRNVQTGRWEGTLPKDEAVLGFTPTGEVLVTLGLHTLSLSDSASGQVLREIPLGVDLCSSSPAAALSRDGRTAAVGVWDDGRDYLRVWDLTTGELLLCRRIPKSFPVMWQDPDTGTQQLRYRVQGNVECLALSPDGRYLAVGGSYTLWICDAWTGRRTHLLLCGEQRVQSLAFSPDGRLLAAGMAEGWVRIWRVSNGEPRTSFQSHSSWVSAIAFSPDGALLATGSEDKSVKLWQVETGEGHRRFSALDFEASSVTYSLDGSRIAVSYSDGTVRLWNAQTGALVRLLHGSPERVQSLQFSPDGARLSAWRHPVLVTWEVATGQIVGLPGASSAMAEARWSSRCETRSPDGSVLAIHNEGGVVELRASNTGELLHVLPDPDEHDIVASLVFSPNGKTLAAGYGHFRVRLWEVETGRLRQMLRTHADDLSSLAFSPDGNLLAVGGPYHTEVVLCNLEVEKQPVRLVLTPEERRYALAEGRYRLQTVNPEDLPGEEVTLETHASVRGVAFSPNGRHAATVGQDAALKLWEPVTGRLLATLLPLPQEERPSPAWVAYTPEGFYHGSPGVEASLRWRIDEELYPAEPFAATFKRPDTMAERLR